MAAAAAPRQDEARAPRAQTARAAAKGELALAKVEQLDGSARRLAEQHREASRKPRRARGKRSEQRRAVELFERMHRHRERFAQPAAHVGRGRHRSGQHQFGLLMVGTVSEQGLAHRAQNR